MVLILFIDELVTRNDRLHKNFAKLHSIDFPGSGEELFNFSRIETPLKLVKDLIILKLTGDLQNMGFLRAFWVVKYLIVWRPFFT